MLREHAFGKRRRQYCSAIRLRAILKLLLIGRVNPWGGVTNTDSFPNTGSESRNGHRKEWWPGTESKRRRRPFQGVALPTELPGHGRLRNLQYRNADEECQMRVVL